MVTGPDIWLSHWYTIGREELPASLLSSFSRAALNCWYLHRSCKRLVSGYHKRCSMVPGLLQSCKQWLKRRLRAQKGHHKLFWETHHCK